MAIGSTLDDNKNNNHADGHLQKTNKSCTKITRNDPTQEQNKPSKTKRTTGDDTAEIRTICEIPNSHMQH